MARTILYRPFNCCCFHGNERFTYFNFVISSESSLFIKLYKLMHSQRNTLAMYLVFMCDL